ncbi:MAG: DGQHR domain-containing protein [Ignavibacteria bacterium]|nr:DGQHR domain-containing protein [Ignavibacteria bacterium]
MIDGKRINNIATSIKSNEISAFPNSILLNCIDDLDTKHIPQSECPKQVKIHLPINFSSCKVVDGQHRLLAFSKLDPNIQDNHMLPIVLFQNMPVEKEIQVFIEVNDTQKE